MSTREDGTEVGFERPGDVLDSAASLVEDGRQLVDDPGLRRDDDVRQHAGSASLRGMSRAIAANGTKILLLSGPL